MHSRFRSIPICLLVLTAWFSASADGPDDNTIENVRRVPPPGIAIPDSDRSRLQSAADQFRRSIDFFISSSENAPMLKLVPDVEIFHKAVDWALRYDELYKTNQIAVAEKLLEQGNERLAWLQHGVAPWTKVTGLVVRGYRSKIDGSVQPYGLVVPDAFAVSPTLPHRLDFWFHGRGEKLTELDFIHQRRANPGQFTPPNTFVLHLYGRYCNANKFAGEVDLFEALDHVEKQYPIDQNRLVVRGFSMGGASAWQFAVHNAGQWAAAAPGAGFSETPEFLKVFQKETLTPTWWEQKLWHLYDATDYAVNLFNCPTVAYSGENDRQMQAARAMERAMKEEGLALEHIIGAGMGHKYDDASKIVINERMDAIAAKGRDPLPSEVKFTTWTLRYNKQNWVTVNGLEEHWERARVNAVIVGDNLIRIQTTNVSHLTLEMPAGLCPLDAAKIPLVDLDGQTFAGAPVMSDRSWQSHFRKSNGQWEFHEPANDIIGRKRPGLQGPIDDAFMDSFMFVRPTGKPLNAKVGAWAGSELAHAIDHWRRQFRGDAVVMDDVDVTHQHMLESNVVLFGDPQSNQLLKRMYDVLPIGWFAEKIGAGKQVFDASHHVVAMIHPNPLNPKRYVVLNSGFTFREYDYLNNARQVPKLPDWAVIDVNTPVNSRYPGKIVSAGFLDERWRFKERE